MAWSWLRRSAGSTVMIGKGRRATTTASHSKLSARRRSRQLVASTASRDRPDIGEYPAASSRGTATVTTPSAGAQADCSPASTKAAASTPSGSSRAAKVRVRALGSCIRSTRKVRQSSRSTSQATRYQRRPVDTRRWGSTMRPPATPSRRS